MSVIAKMVIRGVHDFGSGKLVELSCICENDLMAAYAESEGDKLFTKYSPWGEIKLHSPEGYLLGDIGEAFCVMILHKDEVGDFTFPGSYAFSTLGVASITDYGDGQAKRLDMTHYRWAGGGVTKGITSFNWKMSVDNPSVFNQLKAGCWDYWMAFYPASKFDRNGAIQAAHS